ncbi:hypothetical protein MKW98_014987 [Papaver atlanticum]|uniref:Wall-associated receptor kinase galacturonan-binding domain-containing protein n=1 Tax=Papaver atlanticum TaxID=357466 RepID=A0AAD4SP60_9MAGN|nr:hypothetical protein MKW98_014987 [Papaver atlanticum]
MALLHVLLRFQCSVLLLWLQLASAQLPNTGSGAIAKPECQDRCGNVSIPYPFGIGDGCFLGEMFEIKCNNSEPRYGKLNVTDIAVLDGQMTVATFIASTCSDQETFPTYFRSGKLTVSNTKNKFISIGCDTWAYINSSPWIGEGCSDCSKNEVTTDGSCDGMGCCETSIPPGITEYNVTVQRDPSKNLSFNPCNYAFVGEKSSFRFSSSYLQDFKNYGSGRVPVVLDWTVGYVPCKEAARNVTTYACGPNTVCTTGNNFAPGYLCKCETGFAGNPYFNLTTGGYCQGT